jgi:glyoxylase-like metal-dependent hydrolase (beta-lactamase superfamily II)
MTRQIALDDSARAQETLEQGGVHEVALDLAYLRLSIVNVVFFGTADQGDRNWVLIDTGLPGSAKSIRKSAEARYGENVRPGAIIMTHGHFDHVGAVRELAADWDVPVYCHPRERPFLNGTEAYPPPDPAVRGLMARLSPLYPRNPIDLDGHLRPLPDDGSVPLMPGWRWIFTPGHSPGHISLWNPETRTLLAGDAIVTTGQESAYEAIAQTPEMHGPPAYFTPDWASAEQSVKALAALEPELVITGHGRAMSGPVMLAALHTLADDFVNIAVPPHKRADLRRG